MKHAGKRAQVLVEEHRTRRHSIPSARLWMIVGCNTCGGMQMAGSFLLLDKKLDLSTSSFIIQTLIETVKPSLPDYFLSIIESAAPATIFAIFIFGSLTFSATLVVFLMDTRTEAPSNLSWIRIIIAMGLWMLVGVTVEELFLVSMPVTISFEMILCLVMWHRGIERGAHKMRQGKADFQITEEVVKAEENSARTLSSAGFRRK